MATAGVDKINGINVIVCVPKPVQHSLQPSVHFGMGVGGCDGGRKEKKVVPFSSPSQHTTLAAFSFDRFTIKITSLTLAT